MQDKADWTICESLKGRIDTFKRTMPLIQDLKNPAMRDRHWQQLKQEIQKPFDHTSKLLLLWLSLLLLLLLLLLLFCNMEHLLKSCSLQYNSHNTSKRYD